MPALKRTQLIIQTWEGDIVTSIQYEFEGVVNEYITMESFKWIMDLDGVEMTLLIEKHGLITRKKFGQVWLNCSNLLPFFGWTPG